MAGMRSLLGTAGFLIAIALIYSAADAQSITITRADCANLVRYVPDADISYKPGVGLNGEPVVSADLSETPAITLPETISIPITVDLRRRLGIPADPTLFQTKNFTIGTVEWKDGAAWFNGQPLQSEESRELALLCQQMLLQTP